MHPNEQRLHTLFDSLSSLKPGDIVACYHDQASFEDIAFKLTNKEQIRAMWEFIICFKDKDGKGSDIQATVKAVSACDAVGVTEVEEDYYYGEGSRRRKVHNSIVSTFKFRDGLIIAQKDQCDPVSWASQALGGVTGFVAGHVEPIRRAIAMHKVKRYRPEAFPGA